MTAVASAQGSAARRQPSKQARAARRQRKGDAPVTLVGADEPAGADGTVPVRQKGSRSRRPQRNAPKSVPAAGGGETAPAAGGPPRGRQGKRARADGAEGAPEDAAVAQDGAGEVTGLDEGGALEETDLDVVVTLEGVEDLDAVDLDEFAVDVDVDVDLEVDVDIEDVPDMTWPKSMTRWPRSRPRTPRKRRPPRPDEAAGPGDGPEAAAVAGPAAPGEAQPAPARSGEEGDDETFVYGDDDDDLPAAQVASAGATADPVKDYLKQIGKVPLLNAEQEVELAKRIEAGPVRRGEAGRGQPGA